MAVVYRVDRCSFLCRIFTIIFFLRLQEDPETETVTVRPLGRPRRRTTSRHETSPRSSRMTTSRRVTWWVTWCRPSSPRQLSAHIRSMPQTPLTGKQSYLNSDAKISLWYSQPWKIWKSPRNHGSRFNREKFNEITLFPSFFWKGTINKRRVQDFGHVLTLLSL